MMTFTGFSESNQEVFFCILTIFLEMFSNQKTSALWFEVITDFIFMSHIGFLYNSYLPSSQISAEFLWLVHLMMMANSIRVAKKTDFTLCFRQICVKYSPRRLALLSPSQANPLDAHGGEN